MQAKNHLKSFSGHTLVLSGDVPLISHKTLDGLLKKQINENLNATVLTTEINDPYGYGRIIRDSNSKLSKIKEHKDCSPSELKIKEINSGIYVFNNALLFSMLPKLKNNNAQSEYYLPDVLNMIIPNHGKIGIHKINDELEIQGINTIEQLKNLEKKL